MIGVKAKTYASRIWRAFDHLLTESRTQDEIEEAMREKEKEKKEGK